MLKKFLSIIMILSVMFATLTIIASALIANDLKTDKTHNTYINSSGSFSSYYLSLANPTLQYRYRNLKCDSNSAALNIKLYSYKVHWYNILNPSESLVGTTSATGINANNSSTWYGKTYYDINCSSYSDILAAFDWMNIDDSYSIRYYYDISNNNNKKIYNSLGQWQVISSY